MHAQDILPVTEVCMLVTSMASGELKCLDFLSLNGGASMLLPVEALHAGASL